MIRRDFLKSRKILISLLLFILLISAVIVPSNNIQAASTFTDVPSSHWAYKSINNIASKGIISGYPDGTFRPDNYLKREEAAKMIVIAAGIPYKGKVASFSDVSKTRWSTSVIAAAKDAGIINGYPDGTFKPDKLVSRAEVSAMVTKAFNLKKSGSITNFRDVSSSHWAKSSIDILTSNSVVGGYSDGTFRPNNSTKRSEFAVILSKAMNPTPANPTYSATYILNLKSKKFHIPTCSSVAQKFL